MLRLATTVGRTSVLPRRGGSGVTASRRSAAIVRVRDAGFAACLAVGGLAWATLPGRIVLESPSLGGPRLLTPGDDVDVVVRVGMPWAMHVDAATLQHGDARVPLSLAPLDSDGPLQTIRVRVPAGCPPALYDLEVRAGAAAARTRRAVAVLARIPERFTIAQITDLHIGYRPGSEKLVGQIIDEINRLDPALVVVSGDIADHGRWDEYSRAETILGHLAAPIVTVPGNHDRRGRAGYLSTFGPLSTAVGFGRWTFVRMDAGHGRDEFTLSQIRFLARTLAATDSGRVIAVSHIPLAGKRSVRSRTAELADLLSRNHVPLLLSGHLHFDATYGMPGDPGTGGETRYVVTATAGGNLVPRDDLEVPMHGYQVIVVENGLIRSVTARHLMSDAPPETRGGGPGMQP